MQPRHAEMKLPARGFEWLPGEDFQGACASVPEHKWVSLRPLFVSAVGPSGSGRYWTVTVGVASKRERIPARGFCFHTSTAGWRTLQRFGTSPLPWLSDRNGDGTPELVVWDSFPLERGPLFGLIGWIYRMDPRGALVIDWRKSRELAAELAASYRTPVQDRGAIPALRAAAAEALAAFATGACATQSPKSNSTSGEMGQVP